MSWNYRILAHENNGEIFFQLHEVYYKEEIPNGYTANPITVGSETLKGIKWTLNKMQEAAKKPILWAGETIQGYTDQAGNEDPRGGQ